MIEALFLLFLIINEDLILISATDFPPIGSHTDQKKTLHPMLTLGTDISRSSCHDYILVSPEKYLFREVKSVRCGFDLRDWAHTSIGLHRTFLVAITFLFDLKSLYHSLPQTSQANNLKLIRTISLIVISILRSQLTKLLSFSYWPSISFFRSSAALVITFLLCPHDMLKQPARNAFRFRQIPFLSYSSVTDVFRFPVLDPHSFSSIVLV